MRIRPIVALGGTFLALVALAPTFACDASLDVGDPKLPREAGIVAPPDSAAVAPPALRNWRRHAPDVPCSIYAMAERRGDDLTIGCTGGMLYRFDGTVATLLRTTDEKRTFNFVWVSPSGEIWASAQAGIGYEPTASSELHHFDGTTWSVMTGPFGKKRHMTLTGVDDQNVWLATASEIFHFDGATWTSRYQVTKGEVRSCTFVDDGFGYCVGTEGLALAWNGKAFTPLAAPPWSSAAEVFGVAIEPFERDATFLYGEPANDPQGDHLCRAASYDGTFTAHAATRLCFAGYDVSRKRVGRVIVGGPSLALLSPDDQYGGALIFDRSTDEWRTLCGPILTFSEGLAGTRVGGNDGLLGTIVGSGSLQATVDAFRGSNLDFGELSVAADGAAWARTETTTACGSVTDRLVRFERNAWTPVAAPQFAQSGHALAAVSQSHVFSLAVADEALVEYVRGEWRQVATVKDPFALFARSASDVWIGGGRNAFGRYDGSRYTELAPATGGRQIEQIVAVDGETWMIARGFTSTDTDSHVYRWADGKLTEWNRGVPRRNLHVSALDRTHVWTSGSPAQRWDGDAWHDLPFEADHVWARAPDEVWFAKWGDIFRFDGEKLERVYHGFIPIRHFTGAGDRAFAVGAGGLTLELGVWPETK